MAPSSEILLQKGSDNLKLHLYNLVSREEIPTANVPDGDWKSVSAGGGVLALLSRGGRAAAFRMREDGEGVTPIPLPQDWLNLKALAVSPLREGYIAACDLFGKVHFCTPDKADASRFPKGVEEVALGCVLAVRTPEGRVLYRAHQVVSQTFGSSFFEVSSRALGAASAVADGYSGVFTLRDGRLCLNGRILGAGSDFVRLQCGVSTSLEFALCRRKDGSFLTALMGGTFVPSSLTVPEAENVRAWAVGDRFLACLSE